MSNYIHNNNIAKFQKDKMTFSGDFKGVIKILEGAGFVFAPIAKGVRGAYFSTISEDLDKFDLTKNLEEVLDQAADEHIIEMQFVFYKEDFKVVCSLCGRNFDFVEMIDVVLTGGPVCYDYYFGVYQDFSKFKFSLKRVFFTYNLIKEIYESLSFSKCLIINEADFINSGLDSTEYNLSPGIDFSMNCDLTPI